MELIVTSIRNLAIGRHFVRVYNYHIRLPPINIYLRHILRYILFILLLS